MPSMFLLFLPKLLSLLDPEACTCSLPDLLSDENP